MHGIGHQAGLQHLQALQGQDPAPSASHDQACLEAAVFERLGGTIDYCAHPVGVARVHPTADHLVVEVDPKLGPEHSLPEHCLQALLPTQYTGPDEDEGREPGGIAGVRLLGSTQPASTSDWQAPTLASLSPGRTPSSGGPSSPNTGPHALTATSSHCGTRPR